MPHDRSAAWALLAEFTPSQPLRRHALSVEATMRELARSRGVSDPAEVETWGVVGLLHDFDYERFPTEADHVWRGMEILRERGWPEPVIRAVGAHAFYTGIERVAPVEKAILAADELSGFVGALRARPPLEAHRRRARGVGGEADEGEGLRPVGGPRLHHARRRGVGDAAPRAGGARPARAGGHRGDARARRLARGRSPGLARPAGPAGPGGSARPAGKANRERLPVLRLPTPAQERRDVVLVVLAGRVRADVAGGADRSGAGARRRRRLLGRGTARDGAGGPAWARLRGVARGAGAGEGPPGARSPPSHRQGRLAGDPAAGARALGPGEAGGDDGDLHLVRPSARRRPSRR